MKRIVVLLVLFVGLTTGLQAQTIRKVNISQLEKRFAKGKDTLYVVNFWATWCAPCVAELPGFEKLHLAKKAEPVKVLLVSMDFVSQYKTDLIPFVKEKKLTAEVVFADRKSDGEFVTAIDKDWSGALPGTLVVKNGKRKFYEKQFTFEELNTLSKTFN